MHEPEDYHYAIAMRKAATHSRLSPSSSNSSSSSSIEGAEFPLLALVLTDDALPDTGREGDVSETGLLALPSQAGRGSAILTSGLLDFLQDKIGKLQFQIKHSSLGTEFFFQLIRVG